MDLRAQGHAIRRRNGYPSNVAEAAVEDGQRTTHPTVPVKPTYYGTEVGKTIGADTHSLPRQDELVRLRNA